MTQCNSGGIDELDAALDAATRGVEGSNEPLTDRRS